MKLQENPLVDEAAINSVRNNCYVNSDLIILGFVMRRKKPVGNKL